MIRPYIVQIDRAVTNSSVHRQQRGEKQNGFSTPNSGTRTGRYTRLVRVPAGEFLMGSSDADEQSDSSEKPQHKVYLDEYLIGKYPVTVAQFAAFVQATKYQTKVKGDVQKKGNHPVTGVNQRGAVAFCEWASKVTGRTVRLPTEGRVGKGGARDRWAPLSLGNTFDENLLNSSEAGQGGTTPVGSYPGGASPYDALDMARERVGMVRGLVCGGLLQ